MKMQHWLGISLCLKYYMNEWIYCPVPCAAPALDQKNWAVLEEHFDRGTSSQKCFQCWPQNYSMSQNWEYLNFTMCYIIAASKIMILRQNANDHSDGWHGNYQSNIHKDRSKPLCNVMCVRPQNFWKAILSLIDYIQKVEDPQKH